MEGGMWVGDGMGRGMGVLRIRFGLDRRDGQMVMRMNRNLQLTEMGRWGVISRMKQRPRIMRTKESMGDDCRCDS